MTLCSSVWGDSILSSVNYVKTVVSIIGNAKNVTGVKKRTTALLKSITSHKCHSIFIIVTSLTILKYHLLWHYLHIMYNLEVTPCDSSPKLIKSFQLGSMKTVSYVKISHAVYARTWWNFQYTVPTGLEKRKLQGEILSEQTLTIFEKNLCWACLQQFHAPQRASWSDQSSVDMRECSCGRLEHCAHTWRILPLIHLATSLSVIEKRL